MFTYGLTCDRPAWLFLLLLIPVLWWTGRRTIAALGRSRRITAFLLRSVILALIVLALAEVQIVRRNDRLAVVYLLDQSLSVPSEQRTAMVDFVNATALAHRRPQDLAGTIVFGREPAIESPPYADTMRVPKHIESEVDPNYTDIAAAIKLAQASFPHDTAKRIVLVSDGRQNIGNALDEARNAVAGGIGFDVLPIGTEKRSEIIVEKLAIPADVRKGQPFDLRTVVNNTNATKHVQGRLRLLQRTNDQPVELGSQPVDLPPGKSVFTVRQQIDVPDFYTYEAQFIPDDPSEDAVSQNNRVNTFTHVRGSGQVLLIESAENRGEHEQLVGRLRAQNLEVTVRPSNQLLANLSEMQQFDTVILANVPRSDGVDETQMNSIGDNQIKLLVRNTELLGAGLVMLGGPDSFGAGGWTNTELEKAMPVEFQVKNAKVMPSGALLVVLDRSGSMSGEKLEMSKAAAVAALKTLTERDHVGVIAFDSAAQWVVPLVRLTDAGQAAAQISRIGSGGGTSMMPAMQEGSRALGKVDAAIKHMIVLTDGRTEGSGFTELVTQLRRKGITTTAVAVGTDADFPLMEKMALAGGGKYYRVENPRVIPRIFMKEALRISRSVIYENEAGFVPNISYPHEITSGLTNPLPPLTGYVRTTLKSNPLVEQAILSPLPADAANSTILATWTYGLGRAVAFTTDDGARWAKQWATWADYDKFFTQLVRWSMRPVNDTGKFTVATEYIDNKVKLVVTALDKNDDFLNFLNLTANVVGPDVESREVSLEQSAPGRYVGEFEAQQAGSYFVLLHPGGDLAPIRTGINVPYSAEFTDREPDLELLKSVSELTPHGGVPGEFYAHNLATGATDTDVDNFRRDLPLASSNQPIWHLLVLAAGYLFFFDVLQRRVTPSFEWAPRLAARLRVRLARSGTASDPGAHLDRLRTRKAEISDKIDQRRAAAKFTAADTPERTVEDNSPATVLTPETQRLDLQPPQQAPPGTPAAPATEESYTARLLKAKQRVWDDRDRSAR